MVWVRAADDIEILPEAGDSFFMSPSFTRGRPPTTNPTDAGGLLKPIPLKPILPTTVPIPIPIPIPIVPTPTPIPILQTHLTVTLETYTEAITRAGCTATNKVHTDLLFTRQFMVTVTIYSGC